MRLHTLVPMWLRHCLEERNIAADASLSNRGKESSSYDVNKEKGENDNFEANGLNQDEHEDDDDEEEEDADFNPLLKESPSREASSSLSSEVDAFEADVSDTRENASSFPSADSKPKPPSLVQEPFAGETDHGEEVTEQAPPSSAGVCDKGFNTCLLHENDDGSFSNNCLVDGELKNAGNSNSPSMNLEDEDAIWKRTRARYSLASFTLDELETFLQETDDDDDLQNADEEEYRKFLAAVLLGGEADFQTLPDNENDVDEEDEDNDADFELELEEALESDVDEDIREEIQEKASEGRRPKTRQNRHKTTSPKGSKKLLAQSERPLRPLLPNIPITPRAPFSAMDGKGFILNHTSDFVPPLIEGSINGFTPSQIGQLHCLIYEHVQLLIQIFSLSVLEPARHHVAAKVEELILELLSIRNQVLAWRRLPYPNFCFSPPCVHPSVSDESSTILAAAGRRECDRNGQNLEVFPWVPYVDGPVLSVLDVAPLRLAGKYMNDVSNVVKEYRQFQVRAACDSQFEKEPLFPFHYFQTSAGSHDHLTRDSACLASAILSSSPNSEQVSKRSMASSLVEKAKKQSVAAVPKEIAKLAQIFFPLFNPALYPHKPPPAAVANRVLFTDAEDELLALGLMECNTDWKAIQQRFLPCKSKHQIFVRQKNRSSSKAPENSIKAVRRLKTSPLTTEEMARIQEGLKNFKLDWMSIWKFIVPYRDPSLLPRQWRIANGTQKLYKSDAATKAKRRSYEKERRNSKPAAVPSCHTSSEKEDDAIEKSRERDNTNNEACSKDVTYVHEAFLADWRPNDTNAAGESHNIAPMKGVFPNLSLPQGGSQIGSLLNNRGFKNSQPSSSSAFVARGRRFKHARLVKLAPGLPPVNLPPSVRVISQSAFKSYLGEQLLVNLILFSFENGKDDTIPTVVQVKERSGCVSTLNVGQVGRLPVNSGSSNQQPQHSLVSKNKHVMEEKEKDLQMHPLLFEAPDDGRFPHYPSTVASGPTNFVSGSPPQLNLNLMHNQYPSVRPFNFPERLSEPVQYTSSSSGIHFHPLMQKADVLNYSRVSGQPSSQSVGNLASSEHRAARESNHPALRPTVSHANISSASTRPVSPREKTSELDLDIHLSFPSRRLKPSLECRAVNETSMARSIDHLDSLRLGSKNPTNFLDQSSHHTSASCAPYSRKFDSGVRQSVVPCDEENSVDCSEGQSLPEVIMEQEELSDSEDEIGEDVEFECEEMMDSDTEGSDYEQIVETPNEEMGKVAEDTSDNQQSAPDKSSAPGCSVFGSSRATKVDNSSRSVCLNLNSFPPASPVVENEIARDSDMLPQKVSPCSTTTKKGKKPILNLTRLLEIDTDQQELPNQQCRSIPVGESRKRTRSADSRLSRARSKRTPNGKATIDPASSAPVSPGQVD